MPDILVARGLTALREAEYLTDAGLSASHGLEFVEATCRIVDTYDGSRGDVNHGTGGTLSPTRSAGRYGEISIRGEIKGPGVAYTDPLTQNQLYHVALGCAVSGVVNAGAVALTPVRPDLSGGFSLGFYTHAAYFKFLGCRGSLAFTGNAANRGFWQFTGRGVLAASYPVTLALPSITYANKAVTPPVYVGDTPTLGSWTPVISSYSVSIENAIADRLNGGAATGHAGFVLTNRSVKWAFPGETVALGTYNPFSTSLSGTVGTFAVTHGKNVTGHSFAFAGTKASVRPPELTDDTGRLLWNLGGELHVTNGNDEVTVTLA